MGLYTFATSLKHVALYRKFGFLPRFLTMSMEKEVGVGGAAVSAGGGGFSAGGRAQKAGTTWTKFSDVPAEAREELIDQCRVLTGKVFEGLDVGVEIRSVAAQRLGDTVLLWTSNELAGLAVCHCGAGTEAGSGVCYIKFAAVHPLLGGGLEFCRLLTACEQFAALRGLATLSGGVNTAREEAWTAMLADGWREKMAGLAMQRPNEAGYNRPGIFLIDDWR